MLPGFGRILRAVTRRTKILIGVGAVAGVVLLFLGWQGVRALIAWNSVERVEFDLDAARGALPPTTAAPGSTTSTTDASSSPVDYQTVLVIGSDEKEPRLQDDDFADAILLYLVPDDGSGPAIVSIPRDLVVIDPCSGARTKLDRTLEPCGEAISGPEHVALTVEDYTGIPIDHYALMRFEGLTHVVDAVGGITLCTEHALREGESELLPAGCTEVDGAATLAWLRSRRTQEYVDGEWRFIENVGDAARVERQRVLLFALLDELKGVRSPADLAGLAEQLGDSIVLSDTLGVGDVVALAWDLRSVSSAAIRTVTVPTRPITLPDGSFGLEATEAFVALLS